MTTARIEYIVNVSKRNPDGTPDVAYKCTHTDIDTVIADYHLQYDTYIPRGYDVCVVRVEYTLMEM